MLNKLIKYDFKSLFKTLIPVYLITLLLAIFTRFSMFLADKSAIFDYPAGLICGLCVMAIIGVPFATFIVSVIKYYNNMVKDEGYLTHTLPVKKSALVLSKLITSSVIIGISLLVSLAAIFLGFDVDVDFFKKLFIELFEKVDHLLIFLIAIAIVIGYVSNMLTVYASIALGQKHNGNKKVYSIVYGIVLYNINQIVSSILLFMPSLFDKNYMKYLDQDTPPYSFLNGFLIFAITISILMSIAYYFITIKTMEKKLNLD